MKFEEYLPFLLNQFVPEGMNEDDLPIWVKTLREKLPCVIIFGGSRPVECFGYWQNINITTPSFVDNFSYPNE